MNNQGIFIGGINLTEPPPIMMNFVNLGTVLLLFQRCMILRMQESIQKILVWRTIHDFHVLRFIFKIIFEMKYLHRNYFFLLLS